MENDKNNTCLQGISSNISKSLSRATPPTAARLASPFMSLVGTRQPKIHQATMQPSSSILISNIKLLKRLIPNINDPASLSQRLLNLPATFCTASHSPNNLPENTQIKKYLDDLQPVIDKFQALPPELQKIIISQCNQTFDTGDNAPSYSPLSSEEIMYINSIKDSNPDLLSPNMLSAITNELVILSAFPMPDETKSILTSISIFVAVLSILLYRKSL